MAQPSQSSPKAERYPNRFKKGQSGNPGGRMKGVAAAAREAIGNDPTKLTAVFLEIAMDEKQKPSDRIAAAREYLDRAYGKAPAFAPVEGGNPLELSEIDRAIAGLADELARAREAKSAGAITRGSVAAEGATGTGTA